MDDIDSTNQSATITLARTSARVPREWPKSGLLRTPWIAWSEDEELAILAERRVVPVPNASALRDLLRHIVVAVDSSDLPVSPGLRDAVRLEALQNIGALATKQLAQLTDPKSPSSTELRIRKS